ncbi:efflux RND transporter permease subunit [Pelomonas aquatica]|jgi:multidrug efflux pump|uniref:Efflux RND transporter permease subunit n=1 Tax=Pelomonas aquatica TaxID=431058 RepID=A0A9X4LJ80_9BURK|nr:efflux RND transporter permease subunit [Pelomonas aquatica]MCY4757139.1 efflux RND transporter permease subunit [Pelomonas aquatica]MDG0864575.1 efflux RND transporter permease subunit [Pelomonas aquatica]
MSITAYALKRPRFAFLAALLLVLSGLWLGLDFPSTEEPQVTIRTATVLTLVPGASVERMEQLVARPAEEAIQTLPEVKRVKTTVRPGLAFSYVELEPSVSSQSLPAVWQRLRNRLAEVQPRLPQGAVGPWLDDEFGRVAVLTLGLTGSGYTPGELRDQARLMRDRIKRLPGVERVTLHGLRDEQVQVSLDLPALAAQGLAPTAVADALARRNIVAPAGFVQAGGAELSLQVSGDAASLEALAQTPVALPKGGWTPLGQLARVERLPVDPAITGAFVDGQSAAVIAVSMGSGLNVISFADRLRAEIGKLERQLPVGMALVPITDQAQVVGKQLKQVGQVFLETTVIVMGIVVLFLGLRTGLIVGAIVPTTVLGSLVVMRLLSIDLHIISIGAIIIALGLFVDNAIVVAEDMERRLSLGESREQAAARAGRSMFVPLLVSSLAIILTFMPLVLSHTETGEYLRSMGIVMAIALLLSLLLAVTVTPLLCQRFARHHAELSRMARAVEALTGWYRDKVRWVLGHKTIYIGSMVALLVAAGWLFVHVPSELMPASERRQLQMGIELAPDSSGNTTLETAGRISAALADKKRFPEIQSQAVYVGEGGPRFILALNPPTPAAHRAYAVLSLAPGYSHDQALDKLRSKLPRLFPEVRFEAKRFSMGSAESGLAVFRLSSADGQSHHAAAAKLTEALRGLPGIVELSSDAERTTPQLNVQVDQFKAAAAGLSSADIARQLDLLLAGQAVTQYRDGDTLLPVVVRGGADARDRVEQLRAAPLQRADGRGTVPLGQVADIQLAAQPSVLQRFNQERTVTITAKHARWTAQALTAAVAAETNALREGGQVRIALGGEIEESASANGAISALLPACTLAMFLLFVWQFESLRKSFIVLASIPFVSIGSALALKLTGTTLTFVGTLGLLALAGIIVNNAVLLLDAIEEARASGMAALDAIEDAAAKRLRPIVMTKMVCILGLVPLYLFGGAVWTSLAVVMMGGLALGTLITLGLIPALYAVAYHVPAPGRSTA